MFQKTFQLFLVVFVVLLTTAAAVLLISGIVGLLMPRHTNGVSAVAGGFSVSFISLTAPIFVIVIVAFIYKLTRSRLR
jgi:hypothetical protein